MIPADWPGFEVTRIFQGVTYQIKVTHKGPGNAVSLVVDGKPLKGNIVPLPTGKPSEIQVEVILE